MELRRAMKTWDQFAEDNALLMKRLADNQVPLNAIWLQARCRCEYCGIDLLKNAQMYRGAESDHILPPKRYPNLIMSLSNYAMACASCHELKTSYCFDPGEGDPQLKDTEHLPDELRQMLITQVNECLIEHRRKQDAALMLMKQILTTHGLRPLHLVDE